MKIYRNPGREGQQFFGMLTNSAKMLEFFELVRRVARTEAAVLIRGETGTGKERVAHAIHALSPRAKGPYHTLNCATLSPELMVSELFGHVKGAFTGANAEHKGLFEASHKGTLFLDELAELPLNLQPRLLRVLQEGSFAKLGSTKTTEVDVRLVSATHEALRLKVEQGLFRADLMYRIRVVPIFLPRLIDRGDDVELLTWRFIQDFNREGFRHVEGLEEKAREALFQYPWPGNIRELRNNIEYAFAIGEGPILKYSELTPELRGESPPEAASYGATLHLQEKERILKALTQANGHKGEAARILGLSRATLWRKLKDLALT